MSLLSEVEKLVARYPTGSYQRSVFIRTLEVGRLRYRNVLRTIETFPGDVIPTLKDKTIYNLLNLECDLDREKSIRFIRVRLKELDKAKEDLKK